LVESSRATLLPIAPCGVEFSLSLDLFVFGTETKVFVMARLDNLGNG
jgi:hypothetical protein